MLKKLLILILLAVLLFSFALFISNNPAFIENISDALSNLGNVGVVVIVYIVHGCIFGAIAKHIAGTKGYSDGFVWGFLLGILGLLVVGFRANVNNVANSKKTTTGSVEDMEKLEKLAQLHKQGILSDEEFYQKKAEILARM